MSDTILTQVAKIQLRRGPQADLPGAPTSTSPLVFAPGLDTGEFGFATDTSRLFIGATPAVGQAQYNRVSFPYQNIEVLTENSSAALQAVFAAQLGDMQTEYQATYEFLASQSGWHDVTVVNPAGGAPIPLRLDLTAFAGASASLVYFLYNGTAPVRCGRMQVLSNGTSQGPFLADEALSFADPSQSATDPALIYAAIQFQAVLEADGGDQIVGLQYLNPTTMTPYLCFRIERANLSPIS